MKFGRSLPRNQVPEWSSSYINYKALKKLIKDALEKQKRTGELDLTPFFYSLDRNLETVDAFFNKRLAEYTRRLKSLQPRYSPDSPTNPTIPEGLDRDELEELIGALLELRSGIRKVSWYGEVNRRGFVKILKKADKKTGVCAQKKYLDTKVSPKSFADAKEAENAKAMVNMWLSKAGEAEANLRKDEVRRSGSHTTPSFNGTDLKKKHLLMRRVSSSSLNGVPEGILDTVEQCIRGDNAENLEKVLLETSGLIKNHNAAPNSNKENDSVTQRLLLNFLQKAISNRALGCIEFLLGRVSSLHEEDDIHERNILHRLVIAIGRSKSVTNVPSTIEMALSSATLNEGLSGNSSCLHSASELPERQFFITPAAYPVNSPPASFYPFEIDGSTQLGAHDESVKLLQYILERLQKSQRSALLARDTYGRMPLHYAAQYGFLVICQVVIKQMKEWRQYDVNDGIDSQKWQDNDGLAPLHLAVMKGHPKTTRFLLQSGSWDGTVGVLPTAEDLAARNIVSETSAVLEIAVRANAVAIVKLLVEAGVNLNYQNEQGETALHFASRLGYVDCVRVLLRGNDRETADVEMPEYAYGWTPLFSAAVEGQLDVVKLLVDDGAADVTRPDNSGWTATEHAALRGHIPVTRYLKEKTPADLTPASSDAGTISSAGVATPVPIGSFGAMAEKGPGVFSVPSSFESLSSSPPYPSYLSPKTAAQSAETVKSFGHRYLKPGTTMILVTLGSNDTRKTKPAVNLDRIPLASVHSTQLDTALSVVVSARNAKGEPTIIDLPVQHSVSTDELLFFEADTKDLNKVQLHFDIVPTYSGRPDHKIGRAVALISSIKPLGGKVSLHGGVQVPILSTTDAEVIGTVDFEFLIINSFQHERLGVTGKRTYWKSVTGPKVIGHRGLGKNLPSRNSLQLGENTIQSFIAAANLGASYVEFDVQLTKDHVPVIYHDFCVGETGIDAPVHTLTLEQFLSVSEHSSPKASRPGSPDRFGRIADKLSRYEGSNSGSNGNSSRASPSLRRTRSMSLNSEEIPENFAHERMKYTRNYKLKGFKGNSRGTSIQGPFTTLEEVFKQLPPNLGFNIELKYPMLQESEDEEMDTFGIEMNTWVDTVLKVVYDYGKDRDIIFSSFNPDICLMLSFKQPSIPILFLTECGIVKMADVRASSLQESIRFASRWNLLGIVSAVEPFVLCPRLVRIVKESGLVCVTYGVLNNLTENVKLQVDQGIDAVIVDSVLAIRKGLTTVERSKEGSPGSSIGEAVEKAVMLKKVEDAKMGWGRC